MAFQGSHVLVGCAGEKIAKGPQNSKNSHLYLHVPGMTHGAHEAHPSPLGVCSLLPKELRISGFIS
jgi:hypothetical protein